MSSTPEPSAENDRIPTEWVVYCAAHRHYLVFASSNGTKWTDDQSEARGYTKGKAQEAATRATWRDHNPTPWAIAARVTPSEAD